MQTNDDVCPRHSVVTQAIHAETAERKDADAHIWEVIEKVRDRLPNWAVGVGWIAALIIGALAAIIAK